MSVLSQLFQASGQLYYVHPSVQARLQKGIQLSKHVQPVVLMPHELPPSEQSFLAVINDFRQRDDVFSDCFLTGYVVAQGNSTQAANGIDWEQVLLTGQSHKLTVLRVDTGPAPQPLPAGPYFVVGDTLHQAWRVFADEFDSFMTSIVPTEHDSRTFEVFKALDISGRHRGVAVPSRLYYNKSDARPLAGKRIAVKDNIKVAGVKTTQNNKSFAELYPPDQESAKLIQELLDQGAIIVGKTQLSAFASAEEPTDQCVDYHAPWNPRGDGYQTPAGSSSGAGASLSGYEWLDYSIGTDTSGSIRYPAAITGLFGLRTSTGSFDLNGIYRHARDFDTLGLLSRSVQDLFTLTEALIGDSSISPNTAFPTEILYPTNFLPYEEEPLETLLDAYVMQIEKMLGVKRKVIDLAKLWLESPPSEAQGLSLGQFIDTAAFHYGFHAFYNEYASFRQEYKQTYGKDVYVGPYMRWRWNEGANIAHEEHDVAKSRIKVFRNWFLTHVLKYRAGSILILPVSCYAPDYRDAIHKPPKPPNQLSEANLAPMIGGPQLVIPIGQVPYDSRVTGNVEYHPVTASFLSSPGSDLVLIKLAKAVLQHAGWPTEVQTGRFTYDLSNRDMTYSAARAPKAEL